MHPEEAQSSLGPIQSAESVAPSLHGTGGRTPDSRLPLWLMALGAGVLAGLISWAAGEAMFDHFKIKDEIVYPPNYKKVGGYEKMSLNATLEVEARAVVERKKAMVAFGLLGLALGVCLAIVGGLATWSLRHAVAGTVVGGLSGVAAGAILSMVVVPLFFRFLDSESAILILFLTHWAIFGGIGAASGMALGTALGDQRAAVRALFGGLLGALAGTIAFEAANALAFPLMRTYEPIPAEPTPRILMYFCVAIGIALMAGVAAGKAASRPAAKPSP